MWRATILSPPAAIIAYHVKGTAPSMDLKNISAEMLAARARSPGR